MENQKTSGIGQIDLIQLLITLLRKWAFIFCSAVIVATIAFSYANYCITPLYRAKSTMLVDLRNSVHEDLSSEQINVAQKYVQTFAYVMETNTVLDPVIQELDLDETAATPASKLQVTPIEDTLLIKVSITHPDQGLALQIIKLLVRRAPEIINQRITSGYIIDIETPTVSGGPVSPSISKYTFMGAIIGAFVAAAIIVVIFLMNNRVKSIADLQTYTELPVLGVIPTVTKNVSKSKGA